MLVFKGNPKRIIYVGTTNSFYRRMSQHRDGYLCGNRTIWKSSKYDDIYELMSCQGESSLSRKFKYYASLAAQGKLWAHTTLEQPIIKNDLNKNDNFEQNWRRYVEKEFINNIEVWTCHMDASKDEIILLESCIQRTLQKNFFIESHINGEGMSFLGKIEITGKITKCHFDFLEYPDLDKETINLLKSLPDKRVLKFHKTSYLKKKMEKIEKIEQARIKHQFAFSKWHDEENDIIYTCCKLGINIETIANEHLQRTVKEVENRIKYLSRYYDLK